MKTTVPLLQLHSTISLLLLLILLNSSSSQTDFYDLNVFCGLHSDIVATDPTDFRFIPYYVRLNRCQGKELWGEANAAVCYPVRMDKVKFKAEDRYVPGKLRDILMDNHTECVFACPRNETFCRANQTWNPAMCSCCPRRDAAVCAEGSRWNEEYCSCVAEKKIEIEELPVIRQETEPEGIKVKYIIVIVVAESFILTSLSFMIFCVCCRTRSKEKEKKRREERELVPSDERDTISGRSTVLTNGSSGANNRDSFTYNVDKDQRKFVVSGGQGNFLATTIH